jgi:hypothetical protein
MYTCIDITWYPINMYDFCVFMCQLKINLIKNDIVYLDMLFLRDAHGTFLGLKSRYFKIAWSHSYEKCIFKKTYT